MTSMPRPAFDDVAARALPQLVRAADLMTGHASAADAVVVEALVSVHRRWPSLAVRRQPFDAVRRALTAESVRRHRDRRDATRPRLDLADQAPAEPGQQTTADPVWEALIDLGPRPRAVLVWRICEQLPDQRVARAAGLPVSATRRLARRAVEQVGLTVGPVNVDEISGDHDAEMVEAALAASMAAHHRAQPDVAALLERVRERVGDVPRRKSLRRPALMPAASALLLVVGGVVVWSTDRDDTEPGALTSTPPGLVVPEGTRLVGYRSLAVAVPLAWGRNLSGCGTGPRDTVVYPDAELRSMDPACLPGHDADASTATFSGSASDLFGVAPTLIGRADGHDVFATTLRRRAGAYERVVLVPVVRFSMLVRSSDLAVLEAVVDSVQPVPDGYTVVPACAGFPVREAVGRLSAAGLRVKLVQASTLSDKYGQPPVTRQSIPAGQLVRETTVVGLGFPSMDQ